ncbi:tRNA 2-thiouridine(34) synthase MnmA [Chloroflexus sp. MS-CIW-1]|uniref:tRNA 2-thiouridine(34) synthase MnmA n=1 Tax=Chloroflexus sp. MS-CIW-1 TaxID=3055768 RepID=UPI0026494549|nr:tRNA 2-thiouridine(34) synthase MnmA [Chloroflexus sp. MS-CIW-1]MDN5272627.1 tRNA 2-thiouridine(34) synthase MnmA [Chloroflexus sp. MS-CIW-1]
MANILVAMSGGVDSSLAAALLLEAGHQVTGVTMHLWDDDDHGLRESLCCAAEAAASARRVCALLGIPFYVFNYQREFRRHVIDYFIRAYTHGLTPNPCVECNRMIKFRALLDRARTLGFDAVATGHYARVVQTDSGRYQLWRAVDAEKDQSYMLHMLGQAELSRLLFPIGSYTKREVRDMAAARGLPSADREESQDICFVPDGDYRNLLQIEAPESLVPGPIFDLEGREIGRHRGLPLYTVGQRRGLGLGGGEPRYVVAIDPARNALIVGPAAALNRERFTVIDVHWVDDAPPAEVFHCEVQVRAHAEPLPARVSQQTDGRWLVELERPQRAVSPGQAAVFYARMQVLGGGWIARPEVG